jgi:hypothetical protein
VLVHDVELVKTEKLVPPPTFVRLQLADNFFYSWPDICEELVLSFGGKLRIRTHREFGIPDHLICNGFRSEPRDQRHSERIHRGAKIVHNVADKTAELRRQWINSV